uniref:Uncharacterized protein n=1 Tax=Nelumbo nucifera TaxID=4432 RepID=A0A822ZEE3_NELNU|nr:TPA_asm: hypothetical protein HUJ06_001487 [Nelumbo nucifera]
MICRVKCLFVESPLEVLLSLKVLPSLGRNCRVHECLDWGKKSAEVHNNVIYMIWKLKILLFGFFCPLAVMPKIIFYFSVAHLRALY